MDTISKYNTLMQLLKLLCFPKRLWEWEAGLGKVMVVDLMYYIPECSVCFSTVLGLGGSQTPLLPWEPFTPVWHHKSISAFYYRMNQQDKKIQHAWPKCTAVCFIFEFPKYGQRSIPDARVVLGTNTVILDKKENSWAIPHNLPNVSGGMLSSLKNNRGHGSWCPAERGRVGGQKHF